MKNTLIFLSMVCILLFIANTAHTFGGITTQQRLPSIFGLSFLFISLRIK